MTSFLTSLFRPEILSYQHIQTTRETILSDSNSDVIYFDENENPFDEVFTYNRFPHPYQKQFLNSISTFYGVYPKQIVANRSIAQHLQLIFSICCSADTDSIVFFGPTNQESIKATLIAGINYTIEIGMFPFEISSDFVNTITTKQTPKIIVLSSPNNVIGLVLRTDTIKEICITNPMSLVIVDESLFEYADTISAISLLDEVENLIVLRSFSHSWGMAGIGISLAISTPEIIEVYKKISPMYCIDSQSLSFAQHIADTFRKSRTIFHTKTAVVTERERLEIFFKSLSIVKTVFDSEANFLLLSLNVDAVNVFVSLTKENLFVHLCEETALKDLHCLRISVGTPVDNTVLINSFQTISDSFQ